MELMAITAAYSGAAVGRADRPDHRPGLLGRPGLSQWALEGLAQVAGHLYIEAGPRTASCATEVAHPPRITPALPTRWPSGSPPAWRRRPAPEQAVGATRRAALSLP